MGARGFDAANRCGGRSADTMHEGVVTRIGRGRSPPSSTREAEALMATFFAVFAVLGSAARAEARMLDSDKTWDQRILELIPAGVDATLIDENLRLTPTERVEKMRRALDFIESARAAYEHRLQEGR